MGECRPEPVSDIYVLNEALYCLPHGEQVTDYGALFGFPHQAGALYDGEWGNVVLSRSPRSTCSTRRSTACRTASRSPITAPCSAFLIRPALSMTANGGMSS